MKFKKTKKAPKIIPKKLPGFPPLWKKRMVVGLKK